MLTFCHNEYPPCGGFENGYRPKLMFLCKAEGEEAAIPRVMHKHDERFEIMFIMRGTGIYNIDGRSYQVKEGDLLIFNAGILHDEHPEASPELLVFSCGVEQLKFEGLLLNHLTQRSQVAVMPAGDYSDEIRQLFYQMWAHISNKNIYSGEVANSLLSVLLLICRSIWVQNRLDCDSKIAALGQRIKDFIDDNYKEEISFNVITSSLNMNRFYLAHVFKSFSGYSPKQYQTRRRIGEAQSLLLSTNLGVTEVANSVGYDNVNNFHRIFHNLVGMPPARYKRFWLTGQIKN